MNISAQRDIFQYPLHNNYAVLQKYRYGGEISIEIQCPSELYPKKILQMLIEPLVENSLFHGMGDDGKTIHVSVSFQIAGNDMIIVATDDGIGFTDENFIMPVKEYFYIRQKMKTMQR